MIIMLLGLGLALFSWRLSAQAQPQLLLVEVQTGSASSASDEFVEIYNAGTQAADLENWVLQYRSASGSDWTTKATLSGSLPARSRLLAGVPGFYPTADADLNSGMAKSGGHIRLAQLAETGEIEADRLGWGTATEPEAVASLAPDNGQSLKRRWSEDGEVVDANNNGLDWFTSQTPSPRSEMVAMQPVDDLSEESSPTPQPSPAPSPDPSPMPNSSPGAKQNYALIEITELMVDPDKPATDDKDEFIELYNPNPFTVDLKGYTLKTGTTGRYDFTFPALALKPKQYRAFLSSDTRLTLSNSGSIARLYDPNNKLVYASGPMARPRQTKPGHAWARRGVGQPSLHQAHPTN